MAKSKIIITAGLKISDSVTEIKNDLKKVEEKLDKQKALKINCNLNTSDDSINALQVQLDKISKKLSLNIGNVNVGKIDTKRIQDSINSQTKKVKINVSDISVNSNKSPITQSQVEQLKEYNKEIENATENAIALNKAQMSRGNYPKIPYAGNTDKTLEVAKNTINTFLNGTGDVASRVRRANEDATQSLQSFVVQVEKENGAIETLTYHLNEEAKVYEYLGKTIREASNATDFRRKGIDVQKEVQGFNLDKIESQLKSYNLYTEEFKNTLLSLRNELGNVNDTNGINQYLDKLDVFKAKMSATKTEMQLLTKEQKAFDKAINDIDKQVDSSLNALLSKVSNSSAIFESGNSPEIANISQEIDSLIEKFKVLQARIAYDATPKTLTSIQNEADNLQYNLDEVVGKIESYETVWNEAQKRQIEVERQQAQERKSIVKEIENAYKQIEKYSKISLSATASSSEKNIANENVSYYEKVINSSITRLRNEGLITQEVLKQIQASENLVIESQRLSKEKADQKRIEIETAKAAKEKISFEKAQHDFWQGQFDERIKSMTAENQVLKDMKKYYQELDKATRDFNNTQKNLNSQIYGKINSLNAKSNNAVFRNNSNDPNVKLQIDEINKLQSEYGKLLASLQIAKTPESLVEIKEELDKLTPKFNEVNSSVKELQTTLRNDSSAVSLENRIQKLSNDMDVFANANKRAVESTKLMSNGMTFANKWNELTSRIANGANLSADEIKHLREEFINFGKEAEAVGLKGENAFGKFLNGFKQMTTYISAQAVWGFAKRQISEMIQEVITLNSAMVDLKKVTDGSNQSYERFLKSAKSQSKDLHTTTSDIVAQTAEWSKLGFSIEEAQNLATTSMIYRKVGEVDNVTAVEDLVATMKAFNIEGENSIEIVNRLNKLGNEFSTDAKELGSGLKVSASTLAMAGNDISQTLAMLTGGTEITQNAQEMGTALRTISLRLRGKLMPPYKEIYMLG